MSKQLERIENFVEFIMENYPVYEYPQKTRTRISYIFEPPDIDRKDRSYHIDDLRKRDTR